MLKYYTWKLNWDDPTQGTQPSSVTNLEPGVFLEASMWANPDTSHGTILGYLDSGEIDPSTLTKWQVQELTQDEALVFAQAIDPQAYILPDGVITAPMPEPV